jgi:hypothetical protein
VSVPRLLWRVVEAATLDTLRGRSRGQYHVALARPDGIEAFFAGISQTPKDLQGFTLDIPLEAAPGPPPVPATTLSVVFNGWQAERKEWRIPSQRPTTAYPLWRPGVGPQANIAPGTDVILLLRDEWDRFHARWLTSTERAQLPPAIQARIAAHETGTSVLTAGELTAVRAAAGIPAAQPPARRQVARPPQRPTAVGVPYRRASAPARRIRRATPFSVDPDLVDRGTRAHVDTQNALSDHLQGRGLTPRSPAAGEPPYDLGWEEEDTFFIAEVKSLSPANEERQLRLGLGQLLRYAHVMRSIGIDPIQPVLAAEGEPTDLTWLNTCAELTVILTWPQRFGRAGEI